MFPTLKIMAGRLEMATGVLQATYRLIPITTTIPARSARATSNSRLLHLVPSCRSYILSIFTVKQSLPTSAIPSGQKSAAVRLLAVRQPEAALAAQLTSFRRAQKLSRLSVQ